MKNKLLYVSILATIPLGVFYLVGQKPGSAPAEDKADLVERYGVIQTSSTSGELRLLYYDMGQEKVLDSWEGHPWFFASPEDINDQESTQEQYAYVQSNQGSIFKVVGKKDADDCGYYGNGVCLESIIVERIEVIGKNENKSGWPPTFEQYPIQEVFSGPSAPLDLRSSPIGMQFRTRITEGYTGKPDFAGHYTLAWWGCGVICHAFVIIDNKTGKILGDYTSEHLMDSKSYYGMDYELESNLIILNPAPEPDSDYARSMSDDQRDFFEWHPTKYFKWENNELILIQ